MSEKKILDGLTRKEPLSSTKCALSFYPLTNSKKQYQELDGWLIDILYNAIKTRAKHLHKLKINYPCLTKKNLLEGNWYKCEGVPIEIIIPSFVKSWLYVKRLAIVYGVQDISSSYYDTD